MYNFLKNIFNRLGRQELPNLIKGNKQTHTKIILKGRTLKEFFRFRKKIRLATKAFHI